MTIEEILCNIVVIFGIIFLVLLVDARIRRKK